MPTAVVSPIEQFLALPEDDLVSRELDAGLVIEMAPPQRVHGIVSPALVGLLRLAFPPAGAMTVGQGPGFDLGDECLCIPDLFVIDRKRFEQLSNLRGWYQGAPDIAIEVVSPNDSAPDLDRKIHQFLRAGARAVWAVYPETRHVVVHRSDGAIGNYREGDSIQAPDLDGERRIHVAEVFEGV